MKNVIYNFHATDLVQHYLWDRASEDWDPRLEVFKVVDKEIGKIMEAAPSDSVFIVISDHGFGPVDRIFNINNWLRKEGFLQIKESKKTFVKRILSRGGLNQRKLEPIGEKAYLLARKLGLLGVSPMKAATSSSLKALFLSSRDVNWEETVAYSKADIGHVRLNLTGRENRGSLSPKEAKGTANEIKRSLKEITLPGGDEKLTDWVKLKEEKYFGPYVNKAPDVLFNPLTQNTIATGGVMFLSENLFDEPFKPGNHRKEGLLMASGPDVERGEGSYSIMDLAPTILNLNSYEIPEQLDGRVIEKIAPEKPRYCEEKNFYTTPTKLDREDNMKERLKSLGYL